MNSFYLQVSKRFFQALMLFLLTCLESFSQQVIELPDEPLGVSHATFSLDKVIDARLFKDNIGLLQTKQALVECNFPAELPVYLEQYFKRNFSSSGEKLVLVIQELWISNKANDTEAIGSEKKVELSLAICRQDSAEKLSCLYKAEGIYELSELRGEAAYGKKIRKIFLETIEAFNKTNWQQSEGELLKLGVETHDHAASLFEQVNFPAGLYLSIPELISKQPSILPTQLENRSLEKMYVVIKNLEELIGPKKAFAYSDGKALYIYANQYKVGNAAKYFAPVRETGRFFLVEDDLDARNVKIARNWGLIGLAIASANSGVKRNTSINRNDIGFIVDLYTGKTYVCNDKGLLKLLSEFPEARERYLSKKDRKTAAVWRSCVVYLNRGALASLTSKP